MLCRCVLCRLNLDYRPPCLAWRASHPAPLQVSLIWDSGMSSSPPNSCLQMSGHSCQYLVPFEFAGVEHFPATGRVHNTAGLTFLLDFKGSFPLQHLLVGVSRKQDPNHVSMLKLLLFCLAAGTFHEWCLSLVQLIPLANIATGDEFLCIRGDAWPIELIQNPPVLIGA